MAEAAKAARATVKRPSTTAARAGPGAWAPRAQQGGWGQSPPGWPQYPQAQGWGPQEQGWGWPTPYGKGGSGGSKGYQGPYANQGPRGRRSNQGVWQGLPDVTGAVRVALDTAREIRSLSSPAPAPVSGQSQVTEQSGVGCGWLAAARGWLLGGLPDQRPPAPPLPPPSPSPTPGPRHTDYAALLGQLLGADGQDRQDQDPQSQEVARLTTELARQRVLLALLVDRVAPSRDPAPVQASARLLPAPLDPGEAVGQDAINSALLDELLLFRAAHAGLPFLLAKEEEAAGANASGGAQLPLARPAPPL